MLEFLHHAHKFQTDYVSKQETHKNSRRKLRKIAQSLKAYFLSTMHWISADVEAQLGPQSVALRCHGLHTQMCRLSAVFGCPGEVSECLLSGTKAEKRWRRVRSDRLDHVRVLTSIMKGPVTEVQGILKEPAYIKEQEDTGIRDCRQRAPQNGGLWYLALLLQCTPFVSPFNGQWLEYSSVSQKELIVTPCVVEILLLNS